MEGVGGDVGRAEPSMWLGPSADAAAKLLSRARGRLLVLGESAQAGDSVRARGLVVVISGL